MNARALVRGISGKSLLAFAGIVLLLGAVTGEAAAATVSGKVTAQTSKASVADVYVVATTLNYTYLAEAQPNASGDYTITLPNMAPGTQFLVFVDPKNTRLVSDLNDTIQKTITLPPDGSNVTGVDFKLVDGVKLSGTVTEQSKGSGASGVIVFATNPSKGYKFLGQATTDVNGVYGLLVPPNETAELAVDKQGKFPGTVVDPPFIDVTVTTSPVDGRNFSLIPGVTVQGHVTDGVNPIPFPYALVEAFFVDLNPTVPWTWLDDDTTGPNGFYSVTVAAAKWDQILLRVTASGFVERRVALNGVTLVSPTTTVDIVLSTSVQISGRVTDAFTNPPIGIANVPVTAEFGDQILDVGGADSNGFYTLDVPPNQGFVTIHVNTKGFPYLQPGDGEVVVGTVDFTGIDFALTPAVDITGTVKAPDNGTLVPYNGAGVTAFQGSIAVAFDLTGSSGLPGVYTLKVAKAPDGTTYTVDIHVDAGTLYQTADRFNIVVGQTNIQFVDFELNLAVKTEKVTITKADWVNNVLTVFATDLLQPNATLQVTVVKNGITVVNNATMTFSTKRKQYEFRFRTKTNLNGGTVTVTSINSGVSAGPVTIPLTAPCVSGTLCP